MTDTIQLKNGTQTNDRRLDRLEQFDEKSRQYPIRSTSERRGIRDPRSYTWRCYDWFDQGREGACVAYALGHELAARPSEVKGIHDQFLKEQVYWEAQKIDPWPGGSYPNADPNYEGTSVLAGIKILHKKKFFKEYRWAFGIDDLLIGIGYHGPAVLGVYWYEGMYRPDANGYVQPTGSITGGHAVLARAINVKTETVTIRNSWGREWGVDGDCYIKFDDLEKLIQNRGEAAFMLHRTINPGGQQYQF